MNTLSAPDRPLRPLETISVGCTSRSVGRVEAEDEVVADVRVLHVERAAGR